ncbi:MAG: type III secretion system translocon subunit SctE [Limnobacter sp.]|nr:type III secretion system translocon subunit SctE [Limnobacter sp.]
MPANVSTTSESVRPDFPASDVGVPARGGMSVDVLSLYAETMETALKTVRDSLEGVLEGLKGAEKAKVKALKEKIDDFIKQLEKSKKAGKLNKFIKVFTMLACACMVAAAVVCPTPATIAAAIVAVGLMIDSIQADFRGEESAMGALVNEMVECFKDVFGNVGGIIVATIVMILLIVLATQFLAAGIGAAGSALAGTATEAASTAGGAAAKGANAGRQAGGVGSEGAVKQFLEKLKDALTTLCKEGLNPKQLQALRDFFIYLEGVLTAARGGLEFSAAHLHYEAAKFVHAMELNDADAQLLTQVISLLTSDTENIRDELRGLFRMLRHLFSSDS